MFVNNFQCLKYLLLRSFYFILLPNPQLENKRFGEKILTFNNNNDDLLPHYYHHILLRASLVFKTKTLEKQMRRTNAFLHLGKGAIGKGKKNTISNYKHQIRIKRHINPPNN